MSYDIKQNTITVEDEIYHVKREPDRGGSGEDTLRLTVFDMEQDEFVPVFEELTGSLGYEEDQQFANPREWCNVGTMAVSYRGYDLGDEDISKIDFDAECPMCEGEGEIIPEVIETLDVDIQAQIIANDNRCPQCEGDRYTTLNPVDYFKKERGARVVIGLTVYEHSGITMYAGNVTMPFDTDRWDTSFVGFIFDTPQGVKDCLGDNATDEQIEVCLRDEVKSYASYLEGDVTYYYVQDEETNFHDSCGGYVGDHEGCENECFSAMENAIVKRLAEMKEREEWNSRDTMTA